MSRNWPESRSVVNRSGTEWTASRQTGSVYHNLSTSLIQHNQWEPLIWWTIFSSQVLITYLPCVTATFPDRIIVDEGKVVKTQDITYYVEPFKMRPINVWFWGHLYQAFLKIVSFLEKNKEWTTMLNYQTIRIYFLKVPFKDLFQESHFHESA